MSNLIERQLAVNAIEKCHKKCCRVDANGDEWIHYETTLNEIECVPPIKLSNREWIDFLVEQFDVSRTTAKSMLHAMMQEKREDNFKKQFSGAHMKGGKTE